MKKLGLVGLAAGTLLAVVPFAPAHAAPDPGPGRICGFTSGSDPTGEENVQTGVIGGGPLVLGDDTDPTVTYTGSITCTLQVGANSTHAGTDAFSVTGQPTPAVAVLPDSQASYEATVDENVYLCSQVNIEGHGTLYRAIDNSAVPPTGTWSNDPNSDCGLAISASTPGEDEFPFDVLFPLLDEVFAIVDPLVIEHVDPVLCEVLKLVFPPDGDVPLVWNCPPY